MDVVTLLMAKAMAGSGGSGGGGGVTSWDKLKNRPFYEEKKIVNIPPITIEMTLPPDLDSAISPGNGVYFVKVSDYVFVDEELLNATFTLTMNGADSSTILDPDMYAEMKRFGVINREFIALMEMGAFIIKTPCSIDGLDFSDPGVYFIYQTADQVEAYCKSISTVGCTVTKTDLKQIDPKFIKDMYSETYGVILPETTLTITDENAEGFLIDREITVVTGQTYTVKYNGVEYSVECVEYEGMQAMGNVGAISGGTPTSEPFVMAIVPLEQVPLMGAYALVADLSGATEATMSIEGIILTKMDAKFLPDGILSADELIDRGFITSDILDGKGYVTNEFLDSKNYVTGEALDGKGYVTGDELDSKGYATNGSVESSINEAKEDIKESVDKKQDILKFNTDYDESANKAATMSDIADSIKPCVQLGRVAIERPYSGTTITIVDNKFFAPVINNYADNAQGVMAYSEDGIYWEVIDTLPNDRMWSDIAYGNGIYVAVASVDFDSGAGALARSVDGKNWDVYTTLPDYGSSPMGYTLGRIAFINNMFILVTENYKVYYSYDGIEWAYSNISGHMYFGNVPVFYNGKYFFGVGGGVYSSEDCKKWTHKYMVNLNNASGASVRVLNDKMYVQYYDKNSKYRICQYINDTWVEITEIDASFFDLDRTAYGNGIYATFVQSDDHEKFYVPYYSTDMITWSKGTISSEFGLRSGNKGYDAPNNMVYHNGRFVTCSRSDYNDDTYAYSDDGINWFTTRPALINDNKDMTWELSSLLSGKMFGQFATKDDIKEYVEQSLLGGAW